MIAASASSSGPVASPFVLRVRGWMRSALCLKIADVSQSLCHLLLRLLGPVLSCAALVLIGTVVYGFFTEILPVVHAGLRLPATLLGLLLLYNILFHYGCAVLLGPGRPPAGPLPEAVMRELRNDPDLGSRPRDNREFRYCEPCKNIKPMRAHHCSMCGQCSLKMDHHCPWLNTCVGHRNHRHFILFLFYLLLGTILVSLLGFHETYISSSFFSHSTLSSVVFLLFLFSYLLVPHFFQLTCIT